MIQMLLPQRKRRASMLLLAGLFAIVVALSCSTVSISTNIVTLTAIGAMNAQEVPREETSQNQRISSVEPWSLQSTKSSTTTTTTTTSITPFTPPKNSTAPNNKSSPAVAHGAPITLSLMDRTNATIPSSVTQFFALQRSDRSGAALWDYLNAHAFCFRLRCAAQAATRTAAAAPSFGGACGNTPREEPMITRQANQVQLIKTLGLEAEIPMVRDCPRANDTSAMVLTPQYYFEWDGRNRGFEAFTTEWTRSMKQHMAAFLGTPPPIKTIVVHIRRGDVEPCDIYTKSRYLTNQFYLDLIQEYALLYDANNITYRVIVHSQNRSFEAWSDFESSYNAARNGTLKNLEMKLDVPVEEAWRDIIHADVFVMSKSSFSQAAALFNTNGRVVCLPMVAHCHSRWITVDQNTRMKETQRLDKLVQDRCHTMFDARMLNKTERFQRMGETVT